MTDILCQRQDAFGPITVTDDGTCRTLAFADHDAQSCCLKTAPQLLQYDYTQAMLLVLLFCQPKRVWLLGLGGGSLATALHHFIPGIHITAVELRPAVIELAYRYFQLPHSKRLAVVQQDAQTRNTLKDKAFQWSTVLGFPLTRHLARLRAMV